jgi:hypothetical protein
MRFIIEVSAGGAERVFNYDMAPRPQVPAPRPGSSRANKKAPHFVEVGRLVEWLEES